MLACSDCHDYYLAGDPRTQESITCPHCGLSRHPDRIRQIGEHPEREGAAELRARQLARDAGYGVEYADIDDYGVLGDQLREQDWSVIDPLESSPHSPAFYETAVETACNQHRDAFDHARDHPIGTDWFAEAAADAGVDHPGESLVNDIVSARLSSDQDDDAPTLTDTGGLTLTTDTHIAPACSTAIDGDTLAPTALQATLFAPDGGVVDAMVDAIQDLVADCPSTQDVATYLFEQGVTALDGAYARLVATAVSSLSAGDQAALWRLIALTRSLGGQTELGLRSSLDDIERGPVALLALANETPAIEFRLSSSFFDARSTRRRRFLRHLHRLSPGFEVRIVGSRLTLRQFLDRHGDDLPTSVSEDAQQRLRSRETASTITEQRAQSAVDALEELGVDHPAWDVLSSLAAAQREMRSYSSLYADTQFGDVGKSALRRRLKRLRDADLIETPTLDGDSHARLTPIGHAALEKHPELTAAADTSAPPTSSADWSTGHTVQTESHDGSAASSTVSDPRNSHNSTVLSQRAQEGEDRTVTGGESSGDEPLSSSSRSHSSTPATQYLSLEDHHAAAAAASAGHFALVERSLSETAVHRDHREGRFSYDSDREEVVVSTDYSPSIALTAVRLCSALLSDKAFNQVLIPERLAGHPDGMSLDGLVVSNPYILRDVACLGWLRDVDATGTGLCGRLEQARCDLLAMTGDLYGEEGVDEDVASELLRMAHGLMGVALRLYDLLEIDVVRELRFPNGAPVDDESRRNLRKFLAVASSVGGRYGAYSAHRVLHEQRPEKRDQLLSEPNVDSTNPTGTLLGPWVLTGEGVEDIEEVISQSADELELQEDGENFAPFVLEGEVVDGNRRQAVAESVTRILSFKPELRPDRQAISLLAGLTSDIFAAAQATMALNGDLDEDQSARSLDLHDVRYGLSTLEADALLPEMGGDVVSSVVHALLDVQERASTAELAELADCSTRSLSTESNQRAFAELEAAGLIEREDLGDGRPTLWRLQLPFRVERGNDDPVPTMLVDRETTPTGAIWHLSNAVCEVLTTAADEHGVAYAIPFGGDVALKAFAGPPPIDRDLEPLLRQFPEVEPVVSLLAILLDQDDRLTHRADSSAVELGIQPDPDQATLSMVAG